jgi:hypothetical protein
LERLCRNRPREEKQQAKAGFELHQCNSSDLS